VRLRVISWIESLLTSGDPLIHTKNHKKRNFVSFTTDLRTLSRIGISVGQISKQLFLVSLGIKPPADSLDFRIVLDAESTDIDIFHALLPGGSIRLGLPEGSENQIQVIMQIAFL